MGINILIEHNLQNNWVDRPRLAKKRQHRPADCYISISKVSPETSSLPPIWNDPELQLSPLSSITAISTHSNYRESWFSEHTSAGRMPGEEVNLAWWCWQVYILNIRLLAFPHHCFNRLGISVSQSARGYQGNNGQVGNIKLSSSSLRSSGPSAASPCGGQHCWRGFRVLSFKEKTASMFAWSASIIVISLLLPCSSPFKARIIRDGTLQCTE